jgi:hypothetical protein
MRCSAFGVRADRIKRNDYVLFFKNVVPSITLRPLIFLKCKIFLVTMGIPRVRHGPATRISFMFRVFPALERFTWIWAAFFESSGVQSNGIRITLVQNRFFTTEPQRTQRRLFLLCGEIPTKQRILSLREDAIFQGAAGWQFMKKRYLPFLHKNSFCSVPSVSPW